jgi:FemAB-related protein (PEP-CTERM system-associated)
MSKNQVVITSVTPEDKTLWSEYVSSHPAATAYHQYAWVEAVKKAYGHDCASLIAKDKNSGRVVGIYPSVLMKIPFSGKQICALPYCDLGYGLADDESTLSSMQDILMGKVSQGIADKLEVRGTAEDCDDTEKFSNKKVRMLLSLPESSESLMAGFKSKLRSQIRKAEKNGLTTELGASESLLEHFYTVYATNMRDLGSPVHAKKWFREIVSAYQNKCLISVVYEGSTPIGGGLIIKCGNTASIPWASTLREYNKLAPNMLLYWSLLEHCADSGVEMFDFGRSTFEEGTYKFKKQWGAKPQLLDWRKFDANGELLQKNETTPNSASALRTTAENIWRKLPLKMTITIGSTIRPYISL